MSQNIFKDGIGYEGKVTLTLKSNNRVLESKTYKNSGMANLFKFLCDCLVGSYDEAYLPTKIALLFNSGNGSAAEANNVELLEVRSSFIGLAQTPTRSSTNGTNEASVIYSFEVPRAAIEGDFNQVALYGAGITDPEKFSAYYYLKDEYGNFAGQTVSEWSSTTILLIEWELSVSNKAAEVTNSDVSGEEGTD